MCDLWDPPWVIESLVLLVDSCKPSMTPRFSEVVDEAKRCLHDANCCVRRGTAGDSPLWEADDVVSYLCPDSADLEPCFF